MVKHFPIKVGKSLNKIYILLFQFNHICIVFLNYIFCSFITLWHSMIHELYIFNHLCQTYWLPLCTSTNQINKYNNNNNNEGKVLALLCQGGNSIYHIYLYKYIFVFFLPLPLTLVLFWYEKKTKKSTISNQNQALDMLLRKNTIWHIYFTSVIYHTTSLHDNFLLFTKTQFGKPVQHLHLTEHRHKKNRSNSFFVYIIILIGFFK